MVLLVAIVAIFWLAIFFGYHAANGSSFFDYLRGELEPLPDGLGEWKRIESSEDEPILEERLFFEEKSPTNLIRQRRTRDRVSGAILSTEPEIRVQRQRVRR
jgi:hypothetical protein